MKIVLLPLALILLFGGSFVALNKPFNPKSAAFVLGMGVLVFIIAVVPGWPRIISLGTLFVMAVFARKLVR